MENNKIRQLRMSRGWTAAMLCEKAGINLFTLSMLENSHRKARASTIHKLAEAFNVPVEQLVEFIDCTASERGRLGGIARWKQPKEELALTV